MLDFLGAALGAVSSIAGLFGDDDDGGGQQYVDIAAQRMIEGANEARDIMTGAYERGLQLDLGALDRLRPIADTRYQYMSGGLRGSVEPYADALGAARDRAATTILDGTRQYDTRLSGDADRFAADLATLGVNYANDLTDVAGRYGGQVRGEAGGYANDLTALGGRFSENTTKAARQYDDQLAQLAATLHKGDFIRGQEAAERQRAIAMLPGELTRAQRIALEDAERGATARLAAGGLRGAGRAGVAVAQDGDNRLRAQFEAQNQARADQALSALSAVGQSAGGRLGAFGDAGLQAQLAASRAGQQAGLQLGQTGAGAILSAGRDAAAGDRAAWERGSEMITRMGERGGQSTLDTQGRIGAANLAAANAASSIYARGDQRIADVQNDARQALLGLGGQYYDTQTGFVDRDLAARQRANEAIGIAGANAAQGRAVAEATALTQRAQGGGGGGGSGGGFWNKLGNLGRDLRDPYSNINQFAEGLGDIWDGVFGGGGNGGGGGGRAPAFTSAPSSGIRDVDESWDLRSGEWS